MTLSLLQSPLYGALFGDAELVELTSDAVFVARMVRFERALAEVQGRLGVIPSEAGVALGQALRETVISPEQLSDGVASSGVPVPALVAALREKVGSDMGHWLHWGATSQDVIDTAQVLGLAAALDVLEQRLGRLIDRLQEQSATHAETLMAGRTRGQIATPITFGLRIAQWAAPMIALEQRLAEVRRQALRVQIGGASGSNSAVAPHGAAIAAGLADALGLADATPWHTNRLGLHAAADWLLNLSTCLGKMAGDLILMMRSEIGEARAGPVGGSSTMPQKENPVGSETVRVLGVLMGAAHGGLAVSAGQADERDGTLWPVEWTLLPQMLVMAGAGLRHAKGLADTLEADAGRMRAVLDSHPGAMAEQASFALAAHMSRAEAQDLVKQALATGLPMAEALEEVSPVALDWAAVLDPASVIPASREIAERIFSER